MPSGKKQRTKRAVQERKDHPQKQPGKAAVRGRSEDNSSRPLPGGRPGRPEGMADYIVLLKEEADSQAGSSGRRAIYERNQGRAAEFKRRLNEWLEEKGLQSQVTGIAEPGGFPLITLTSTPAVAEAIESFPEVESVVEDSDLIGFVPTVTGKRITRLAGRHGK